METPIPSTIADQAGSRGLRSGWFLIQYYVDFHLSDRTSIRKRVSKNLSRSKEDYTSSSAIEVAELSTRPLSKPSSRGSCQAINPGQNEAMHLDKELLITDFWNETYHPSSDYTATPAKDESIIGRSIALRTAPCNDEVRVGIAHQSRMLRPAKRNSCKRRWRSLRVFR